MFVYFMSLKPGHFKSYSQPENSFWCCVGTGMENHAKYGDTIYFHGADSLYVNLFIASELNWKEQGPGGATGNTLSGKRHHAPDAALLETGEAGAQGALSWLGHGGNGDQSQWEARDGPWRSRGVMSN